MTPACGMRVYQARDIVNIVALEFGNEHHIAACELLKLEDEVQNARARYREKYGRRPRMEWTSSMEIEELERELRYWRGIGYGETWG